MFAAIRRASFVVKPLDGSGGKGVTTGIKTREHFDFACSAGNPSNRKVALIVERHVPGEV